MSGLRTFLRVPDEVWGDMRAYLFVIFMGIPAVFLYNYFALHISGQSVILLYHLRFWPCHQYSILYLTFGLSSALELGVAGAAQATVISQYLSGLGIMLYTLVNAL